MDKIAKVCIHKRKLCLFKCIFFSTKRWPFAVQSCNRFLGFHDWVMSTAKGHLLVEKNMHLNSFGIAFVYGCTKLRFCPDLFIFETLSASNSSMINNFKIFFHLSETINPLLQVFWFEMFMKILKKHFTSMILKIVLVYQTIKMFPLSMYYYKHIRFLNPLWPQT